MSHRFASLLLLSALLPVSSLLPAQGAAFRAGDFLLGLDGRGRVVSLRDGRRGEEYLPPGMTAPLLSLRVEGKDLAPLGLQVDPDGKALLLDWGRGFRGVVRVETKGTHLRFDLVSLEGASRVDLVLWGPFPTTLAETVGETVGVVRDSRFALGIQALNLKTLGGYPTFEDDHDPTYEIERASEYVGIPGKVKLLFRGQTARFAPFGSVLQAYCRNRNRRRVIPVWDHPRFVVPPLDDGGVVGTCIALFGCPPGRVLETLGRIELAEGLPHPILDGKWGKVAPGAVESYLILSFGEENLDEALDLTEKAGLRYLYQGGPFRSWGHFELNPKLFPHGWAGLRKCVERAARRGIRLGVHTLSNFITTNDPYVRPVPDPRLAKIGSTRLAKAVGPKDRVLFLEDPGFFLPPGRDSLHTVQVGEELIRYGRIAKEKPWRLLDCKRGAFGTKAAAHPKGAVAARLLDHYYKVFLTDADLSLEVAGRIARLFNETSLRQISFDGLEGNWSTGMGQYGRQRFVMKWYQDLKPSLRGKVITDASNPGHFFWHVFTRMNWGEPWYAGFRESQTRYRLQNQDYFHRNYIPPMLGWFLMSSGTSLEDIEWLLARAAGFGAGFALVTSFKSVKANGSRDAVFRAIRLWEGARRKGLFSEDQKRRLRDIRREFHLEFPDEGGPGRLYPVAVSLGNRLPRKGAEGEGVFFFHDPFGPGPVKVTLSLEKGGKGFRAGEITLQSEGGGALVLPSGLGRKEILRLTKDGDVLLFDRAWNEIRRWKAAPLRVRKGRSAIRVSCRFEGSGKGALKVEFRARGPAEKVPPSGR